ncbi:MAG: transcriptional regulator [Acidimicrobiia bacterium]|nr:transcriptional regulator [Acidimicrobiia bacterium]MBV9041941.1 transcriptional regulator [Acidimicrobiia bacterium]MBV9284022.1 transcriptional regulator [Acidimicrobiia bacterium]
MAGGYARRVGERLRAIRKQKGLSLQEVEGASKQEFKASVLGAYERGERAISVPRLQRLARFYNVPVDQLLPRDAADIDLTDAATSNGDAERSWDGSDKITIDLTRFEGVDDDEARVLHRYVNTIQVQRQDFNGRMLTIRRDDLRAIAAAAGIEVDALVRRLDDLQLRRA